MRLKFEKFGESVLSIKEGNYQIFFFIKRKKEKHF